MAKKYNTIKGKYNLINPSKYFGGDPNKIIYRSSWEFTCMQTFDKNPAIIGWGSETCSIPYMNPFTGRNTVYIPDFVVVYEDSRGRKKAEMIEVKPAKEVPGLLESNKKISRKDQMAQALNAVKWEAAMRFCRKRGLNFRVMTEFDIYTGLKR